MQNHNLYSSSITTEMDQIYATRHWSEQLINDESVFLYVLSPIGNIIYCSNNSSCKRITTYDATDLIGQSISQFLHPDECIPFFQSLKQIFDIPHRMTKTQFRWKIKHSPGYLLLQSFGYSKIDQDILSHHPTNNHTNNTSIYNNKNKNKNNNNNNHPIIPTSSAPSSMTTTPNHPSLELNYSAFFTITVQTHYQQHHLTYDPATYDMLMKLKMENQLLQQRIIQLTNSTINHNHDNNINININSNNEFGGNHPNNMNHLEDDHHHPNNNNNTINIINHTHNNHLIHFYHHHQNTTGSNLNDMNNNINNNNNSNNNNNNMDTNTNHLNPSSPEATFLSTTNHPFPIIEYDTSSMHPSSSSSVATSTIHFTSPLSTTSSSIDKFNNNNNINTNNNNSMLHISPPPSSSSSSSWASTSWQQQQSTADPNFLLNFTTNESIKKETLLKKENDKEEKKRKQKKIYATSENYQCMDCGSRNSPEWRKGPLGPKTLCNACGLRWAKKNKKQVM
ncbi:unnamed protein product [Cunninghamella blakesleeana]